MTNHEKDLLQLQKDVALKKQLEVKLKELRDQRQIFDQKVIKLRVEHRSEQKDVEKLEGRSLSNYFYQVVGKIDDKLKQERKQITSTSFFKIEKQIPEWTDHVTVAERGRNG